MYGLEMHYKSGMQNSEPFLKNNNEIFRILYNWVGQFFGPNELQPSNQPFFIFSDWMVSDWCGWFSYFRIGHNPFFIQPALMDVSITVGNGEIIYTGSY